jgi:hypothetical protein
MGSSSGSSRASVPQVEIGWAEGPPSPTLPPKEQSPNSNGNDQVRRGARAGTGFRRCQNGIIFGEMPLE